MDNPNNVITESADKVPTDITAATPGALLGVYQELCDSYHAIDDFRMKLLGLLPLTSLIGIFGLSSGSLFAKGNEMSQHLITFIGVFAAAFTIALFIYEIRGIFRSSNLIERGRDIEGLLHVKGQFFVCVEEGKSKKDNRWTKGETDVVNAKLAACVIYSTVFAAWIFTLLRFGFHQPIYGCAFSALGFGLAIGVCAFLLVRKLIAP
jgi:hypothetical protein